MKEKADPHDRWCNIARLNMHNAVRTETVPGIDVTGVSQLAFRRWFVAILILGLVIFVPAGTLDYWQAWAYIVLLGSASLCFIGYYLKRDPELILRRMKAHEKEREQRKIIWVSLPLFVAVFVVPGLDRRFLWSSVPTGIVLAAEGTILLGYLLFVLVMRENRYASRVVEVAQGQRVITTGPYAIVRHPMYVALLMMYLATPVALGSYWGIAASVWLVFILVARIRNEEKVLLAGLTGYGEYCSMTRYRLIPRVW